MSAVREIRRHSLAAVIPVICFAAIGYFAYHAMEGEHGINAYTRLTLQIQDTKVALADVTSERRTLERRVGLLRADGGEILIDGKPVTIDSPATARSHGIAYVPEDRGLQGLIKPQTIRENVSLAILDRLAKLLVVDRRREGALARESIARFGIRARGAEQLVRQLSGGNQQKVVLAKWIATEPRVLIMDEPTRGIDVGAKAEIHALMSKLAGQGLAVLMISSELPEVLGMSDRVLVMRGGAIVAEFDRAEATPDAVGAAMTAAGKHAVAELAS